VDTSTIYVHDGRLLRVIEEPDRATLTLEVELPAPERIELCEQFEQLIPRLIVFEGVCGYQVIEECKNGCPTLLGISVVGQEGRWSRVRLDTTVGHREILCAAVRLVDGTKTS
jgi:hypothetical protein